jgi:non-lysosomal glucosylceramidase
MGSENTETPEYQVGGGCLADQLIGQYLAELEAWGLWCRRRIFADAALDLQVQLQANSAGHDNVERTYALNEEAAVVVCDYGKAERPHIPFPYYAEAWTGQEYLVAALMMNWGMVKEGVECVQNVRARLTERSATRGTSRSAATTMRAPCLRGPRACDERLSL